MIELATALEATELAQFLKRSRWVYPLINAHHVMGLGLLLGSVVAMDLRLLGLGRALPLAPTVSYMRLFALAGLALALVTGALLFVTQAGDYARNGWFRLKLALLLVALVNAAVHLRITTLSPARRRTGAILSLALWPSVVIAGRMIAYS